MSPPSIRSLFLAAKGPTSHLGFKGSPSSHEKSIQRFTIQVLVPGLSPKRPTFAQANLKTSKPRPSELKNLNTRPSENNSLKRKIPEPRPRPSENSSLGRILQNSNSAEPENSETGEVLAFWTYNGFLTQF